MDPWIEISRNRGLTPAFLGKMLANQQAQIAADKERAARYELVRAKQVMRDRFIPEWAREIIVETCLKHAVELGEMLGASRRHIVMAARNEAMYRIKSTKPMLSSPKMGQWFAKDHTSILHSLATHAARYDLPKLVGFDLARSLARKRKRDSRSRAGK